MAETAKIHISVVTASWKKLISVIYRKRWVPAREQKA